MFVIPTVNLPTISEHTAYTADLIRYCLLYVIYIKLARLVNYVHITFIPLFPYWLNKIMFRYAISG